MIEGWGSWWQPLSLFRTTCDSVELTKNIIQARLVSDALEVTFYIGWVLGAPLSDIYFEGYERYVHFIGQISRYVHNISIYIKKNF